MRVDPAPSRAHLLLALSVFVACAAPAEPGTAMRGTISTDTGTAPEGRFELETGFIKVHDLSPDYPTQVNYGSGERTELFLGLDPRRFSRRLEPDQLDPVTEEEPLEAFGGVRHRFADERTEDDPDGAWASAAFQAAVNVPIDDQPERGPFDLYLAGVFSKTHWGWLWSSNLELGLLTEADGGPDVQVTATLAGNGMVVGPFGAYAEVAGSATPERKEAELFGTGALTYALGERVILDAGLLGVLGDGQRDPGVFFGLIVSF